MALAFNADDVFELAEQIERNGAKFYRRAAGDMSDKQTREVLLDLAAKEDQHLATFVALRKRLSEEATSPTTFDPYGDAPLYLQAMADAHVFGTKQAEDVLTGRETARSVLELAIGFEKDTIAFFTGMKETVPERLGKPEVDRMIKEEMTHVVILSKALSALS
jgi:rubrerythrin